MKLSTKKIRIYKLKAAKGKEAEGYSSKKLPKSRRMSFKLKVARQKVAERWLKVKKKNIICLNKIKSYQNVSKKLKIIILAKSFNEKV